MFTPSRAVGVRQNTYVPRANPDRSGGGTITRLTQLEAFNHPGNERVISLTEYVCFTLLAEPLESESAFKARLTSFWTHMLRNKEADYERVYAEATRFNRAGECVTRQYMVEVDAVDVLSVELAARGIAFSPVDVDDTYSKYEAASPDWFQIEH